MKEAATAASCSSYQTQACATYCYECAAGDIRYGSTCSSVSRVTGNACTGPGGPSVPGTVGTPYCTAENNWCGGGNGWGGGWGGSAPIPLSPTCVTPCSGPNCRCLQHP